MATLDCSLGLGGGEWREGLAIRSSNRSLRNLLPTRYPDKFA